MREIDHVEYLRKLGDFGYSRRVIDASFEVASRMHVAFHKSRCHRALGNLDADADDHTSAREHYESALKIARGISHRTVLIEALLGRGRWRAKYHEDLTAFENLSGLDQAFNDLNEALGYAVEGEYRIYEADIRVALAWAHLANDEGQKARAEAERALSMSKEMGYHWGQVDAEEVLEKIVD